MGDFGVERPRRSARLLLKNKSTAKDLDAEIERLTKAFESRGEPSAEEVLAQKREARKRRNRILKEHSHLGTSFDEIIANQKELIRQGLAKLGLEADMTHCSPTSKPSRSKGWDDFEEEDSEGRKLRIC